MEQTKNKASIIIALVSFAVIVVALGIILGIMASNSITKSEFEKIEYGMTYEEVVEIVGCEGELGAGASVGSYSSSVYTFKGTLYFLNGANAAITFSNGRVTGMASIGLIF
jgi:hypothetical protein